MKICIVGNYRWDFYEKALVDGFKQLGHFPDKYIIQTQAFWSKVLKFWVFHRINEGFFKYIYSTAPDAIFLYRVNELYSSTLEKIKNACPHVKIICFHNDNPFEGVLNKVKYSFFLHSIKYCDILYVYRPSNLFDGLQYGANDVKVLMPYYYSKVHLNTKIRFNQKDIDVVYVGHVENDGRIDVLDYLIKNKVAVKIFGPGWKAIANQKSWPVECANQPVYQNDYFETISRAKIALCFFSKTNHDIYTRRIFEIPAIGSLLATEKSEFIENNFIDGQDVLSFSDKSELLVKIVGALKTPDEIVRITINGHEKIISAGHSEKDRAYQIFNDLEML